MGFLEGKERVIFVVPTMMKVTIQMVMEAVIAAAPFSDLTLRWPLS